MGPIDTETECLVLPCEETNALNDSRLHNFLSRENTPSDSVGAVGRYVRSELTILGNSVSTFVQLDESISDLISFGSERCLTPRQRFGLVLQITDEKLCNVLDGLWFSPLLAIRLVGAGQPNAVSVQLSEGRRTRITPSTVRELVPVLSDIFFAASESLGLLPRESLLKRALSGRSPGEFLEQHTGGLGEVHGIEVKVMDTVGEQFPAHIGDQCLSNVSDSNIIVLDGLKCVEPLLGDFGLHMVGSSQEAGVCGNGHDTGKYRNGDTTFTNTLHPANEIVGVVEHLCDNKSSTHINLLLEVVE
ncbi:hypothetical protein HG530_015392 [Fusarium avenaceum]|nr:hypothetical protein HG530_015392 [Fusarium avenaceum]